jgi:hypothetical protein
VFANKQLRPARVILLLRGVCKGESTASLSRELQLAYDTVQHLRQQLHTHTIRLQPETPLPDAVTETDEMFQNAGKKGKKHNDPTDPPRRRANKQKGHGTYENDRPPIIGTVGRDSGQVRWARDEDGDGMREIHINTTEGMWTETRNFLRLCRGVNKDYLSGYVAMCEHNVNLKRITPQFIAGLVRCT